MLRKTLAVVALGLALAAPWGSVRAEDGDWTGTLGLSVWPTALEGESRVGPATIPLNLTLSDFELSPTIRSEVTRNRFSLALDIRWLRVGEDNIVLYANNGNSLVGNWDFTLVNTELLAGFRVLTRPRLTLDALAGVRHNYQNMDVLVKATLNNGFQDADEYTGGFKDNWFDPFIGVRAITNTENRWWFNLRGDFGGFDVGSKMAWNVDAFAAFRVSEVVDLTGGLRFLDVDYSNDEAGREYYSYNARQSGIVLGAIFRL